MAFDLHITFAGMCLLVHDRTALHVLLPPTHHPHDAKLFYSAKHDDEASNPEAITTVELRNTLLDLRGLTTASSVLGQVPATVVDLGSLGLSVERKLFESIDTRPLPADQPSQDGLVLARISLASGTGIIPPPAGNHGAVWKLRGTYRQLAIKVQWTIRDVSGSQFLLQFKSFNGNAALPADRKLTPFQEGGRDMVHLYVFHAPRDQVPAKLPLPDPSNTLEAGEPASHFISYYSLLGLVPELAFVPEDTLAQNRATESLPADRAAHERHHGAAGAGEPGTEEGDVHEHRQAPARLAAGTDLSCAVATAPPK